MAKIAKLTGRAPLIWTAAVLTVALFGSAGQALARASYQTTLPLGSGGHTFETSRGPAYITGSFGSLQTTTLPGSGGQGVLMSNGNGTSTLIAPGTTPQIVASPR